jgi:hypothetical protein
VEGAARSSCRSRAASCCAGRRRRMWREARPRRIFAYTAPTDMRKSFHGLLALVQQVFRDEDPYGGSLFVFVNRRGSFLKGKCSPSPVGRRKAAASVRRRRYRLARSRGSVTAPGAARARSVAAVR